MEHSTAKWTTMETCRDTGVPTRNPMCVRVCLFVSPCPCVNMFFLCAYSICLCTVAIHVLVCVADIIAVCMMCLY